MGAVGKLNDPRPVQVLYTVSATYAQPSTSRDGWRFRGDQGVGHGTTHCGVTTETVLMKLDTILDKYVTQIVLTSL
mgnify:CR=1 FL=1